MSHHETYTTHLDNARAALSAGDYFTAERECVLAEMALAALPAEAGRGNQGDSLKTRVMEEIQQLLASIRTLAKRDPGQASPLITSVPLQYNQPGGIGYAC